jgi:hypothetical protein
MRRLFVLLLALLLCGCLEQGGGFSVTSDHVYFESFSMAFSGMDVLASNKTQYGERVMFSDGSAIVFNAFASPMTFDNLTTYAQAQLEALNARAPTVISGGKLLGIDSLNPGEFHGRQALIMTESLQDADGNDFKLDMYYMACNNTFIQATDLNNHFSEPKCAA